MKKLLTLTAIIAMAVLFGGCPYSASIPIDQPTVKADARLMGTWKESSDEDTKYKITAKDENTFSIEKREKSSDPSYYDAYLSNVGGTIFVNLWSQSDEPASRTYYFYKLTFNGDDMITLAEVTENIDEEFSTSESLKKFIADNLHNSYFYTKDEQIFSRVK